MTPEELVSQLAPIRVPSSFAEFGLQEGLCVVSLGLVAGLLAARLWRWLAASVPEARTDASVEVAALSVRPRHERLLGLAMILRRMEVPLPGGMSGALYDPAAAFDPAIAERAALAARRGRRRPA
jgi:hypothetical protein